MPFNDTQKDIVNSAACAQLYKLWGDILDIMKADKKYEMSDKLLTGMRTLYNVISQDYRYLKGEGLDRKQGKRLREELKKSCLYLGYTDQDFRESPFYRSAVGLRKMCKADPEYFSSPEVQLHTIKSAFPEREEVAEFLRPRFKIILRDLKGALEDPKFTPTIENIDQVTKIFDKAFNLEETDSKSSSPSK